MNPNQIRGPQYYQEIIDASPSGMIVINREGTIILVNKKVARMFGYRWNELLSMKMEQLLPERFRNLHHENHKEFYKDPTAGLGKDFEGLCKDGTEFSIEIELTHLKFQEPDLVLVTIGDITYRKRYEKELIKLKNDMEQELEKQSTDLIFSQAKLVQAEKLAILGQFAGSIGHEFRNQLGVMRNTAYFIKMKLADEENRKIIKHLNILEEEIILADRTIENLMTFARKSHIEIKEINLREVLAGSVKADVSAKIKINIQTEKDLPRIEADPIQLKSVFDNVIINAVQAMKEGNELLIEAVKENDCVIIRFKDNGCGINEEDLEMLFVPLFTTKPRGTGLGLMTVKKFVESHHGRIDVKSQVNKGTTVTIKLPIKYGTVAS